MNDTELNWLLCEEMTDKVAVDGTPQVCEAECQDDTFTAVATQFSDKFVADLHSMGDELVAIGLRLACAVAEASTEDILPANTGRKPDADWNKDDVVCVALTGFDRLNTNPLPALVDIAVLRVDGRVGGYTGRNS